MTEEVDFDVETAIDVCRAAAYHAHALRLAEKHGRHHAYLRVQLDSVKDYRGALAYIRQLDFPQVSLSSDLVSFAFTIICHPS